MPTSPVIINKSGSQSLLLEWFKIMLCARYCFFAKSGCINWHVFCSRWKATVFVCFNPFWHFSNYLVTVIGSIFTPIMECLFCRLTIINNITIICRLASIIQSSWVGFSGGIQSSAATTQFDAVCNISS